jgi:hypothetical protein
MGLDAGFKEFLRSAFPESVADEPPQRPDAIITDCMCVLHMQKTAEGATLDALARALWRSATSGARADSVIVLCFDCPEHTPRVKELEHKRRAAPSAPLALADVDDALEKGLLPHPWSDAVADRRARARVVAALAGRAEELFLEGPLGRRLIVHGLGGAATARERASGARRADGASGAARLLGEGDVSMCYWARRLAARRSGGTVLLNTVDTDLVAILALHACPGLWVALRHWDRKAAAMRVTAVDIWALATLVEERAGLPLEDFVAVCVSRGTDFAERAASGVPAWAPYVHACALHLRQAGTRLVREEGLDAGAADGMLRSVALGKRARVVADRATYARMAWNLAYWRLAPAGLGAACDPLDPRFGWVLTEEGEVQRAVWPGAGGGGLIRMAAREDAGLRM